MHNLNLLPALGLLLALGHATPVLRGTNDTLSRRLWSEAPVSKPTFISQPFSELPVPTFIAPHYSQPVEPSWALAPEPTEALNSLLARQGHAPSEPISSDIGPSQPATPEPTFIAPQHGQPPEPISADIGPGQPATSVAPYKPTSSDIGLSQPATSIVPYEPTSFDIRPSVSIQPSSEPTETAPIISGPTPVISGPAPVISRPAPVISSPAPVISRPAPVISGPAPSVPAFSASGAVLENRQLLISTASAPEQPSEPTIPPVSILPQPSQTLPPNSDQHGPPPETTQILPPPPTASSEPTIPPVSILPQPSQDMRNPPK